MWSPLNLVDQGEKVASFAYSKAKIWLLVKGLLNLVNEPYFGPTLPTLKSFGCGYVIGDTLWTMDFVHPCNCRYILRTRA